MGFFLPVLVIGAGALLYKYLADEKKVNTSSAALRGVAPAGATTGPQAGPGPSLASPAAPPPNAPPIPPGTPAIVNPNGGGLLDPRSPAANAIANLVQPPFPPAQQADNPPLPKVPPQAALPVGSPATVNTSGVGNSGALRVRSAPSTVAAVVAGGEPASGGGFEHGATVQITGPLVAGFSPVSGAGRLGGTLTGYAWGGYLQGQPGVNGDGVSDQFGADYASETD